ncbi:MAG: 2-amino-4-oxopentanoate thiolase subunit OrtB [Patescibacteria group bacterium]
MDTSYAAVMARREEIMRAAVGLDYASYRQSPVAFDYEALMGAVGLDERAAAEIQAETGVGRTPLLELRNLTALVRSQAPAGRGARILVKDEAANPSGSFKARRASLSVHQAAKAGYAGVIAATSGNYGAAMASQAAMRNLRCIVVQEAFDSRGVGQPEILEKGRACEAYGAEVWRLTVGPELFYFFLLLLEETGYFNASLYTPYSVAGIETLGGEIGREVLARYGREPAVVAVTHAGGGNVTGTARGLRRAGCRNTAVAGVSVDLRGLHMASDRDFNRKSFTTGHSGFGLPFLTRPDRADVPYNAARALRYLDRYLLVSQGEVFYVTELLAKLEGLERGPAGNTSLAAAMVLAKDLPADEIVVVQETEYTGAGKHHLAQLSFAREQGVEILRGDPRLNEPGRRIVLPEHPGQLHVEEIPLAEVRRSYLRHLREAHPGYTLTGTDIAFIAEETRLLPEDVERIWKEDK